MCVVWGSWATYNPAVPLKISKLNAAKRQLETAIRLYFCNGDPVSIHTVAAASYTVLRDVTEKSGADPMLIKGHFLEMVKPEYKKEFLKKVNEAENFFKHADNDHQATLEFEPELTELHMIDACAQYRKLTGHEPIVFAVYRAWFTMHHPDAFILADELKAACLDNADSISKMGRTEYFRTVLDAIRTARGTGT